MKNELFPIKKWLGQNRWTIQAVAESTGLHYQTVFSHAKGETWPSMDSIKRYKEFGIPREVILAHLDMMANKG